MRPVDAVPAFHRSAQRSHGAGGRVDGDFIPEVRSFHESRPGYRYTRSRELDEGDLAAAGAAAAGSRPAGGGLLDAS